MSGRDPSARLFVAVDPPASVAEQLAVWARSAARGARSSSSGNRPSLRVLDAELLHVTVCFLGNRSVQSIPALTDELAACERPAMRLSVGAPLWLPPRRPRALAVELHDESGALARVHAQVAARLEPVDEQSHAPSASGPSGARAIPRRFRPHITVVRMRSDGGKRPPGNRRGGTEPALPPTPALSFAPAELVLYRSWLSPAGATYEALSAFPLG